LSVVYALATPASKSALCVFRVSGPGCLDGLQKMFSSPLGEPRKFYRRSVFYNDSLVDDVGVVFFKAPSSYTGEDSFEIYAHGGFAVMRSVVDLFKSLGFDEAGPGEFTKRAFINGKLSLNEAESVVDTINNSSSELVSLSANSLGGGFSKEVFGFSSRLDGFRKFIEGSIDFSDEDYDFINEEGLLDGVARLCADFGGFINKCYSSGEGFLKKTVLFVGPPNSGKSSLFNRMLGFDRALVSDVAGTTRDLIESEVFYNNSSFSVLDSAGIRESSDQVEKEGIALTVSQIEGADVVVGVFDSADPSVFSSIKNLVSGKSFLSVLNKVDLGIKDGGGFFDLCVSAKTGDGIVDLKRKITSLSSLPKPVEHEYLARSRHIDLFNEGLSFLEEALLKLRSGKDVELAAEDLRLARASLDEVVGIKTSDSLLGDIFKDFCIGK
jgi:tRNA modification GTPase